MAYSFVQRLLCDRLGARPEEIEMATHVRTWNVQAAGRSSATDGVRRPAAGSLPGV